MNISARRNAWTLRLLPLGVLAAALALGIIPRLKARAAADRQAHEFADPSVAVTLPEMAAATRAVILPGEIRAFQEADIYARTDGYIGHWYTDIGTPVQNGELLASIDAAEVDAALQQARSDAATAEANYSIAKITAERWVGLLKTRSVSQQQTQDFVSAAQARQAMLASAAANVARLAQLQSYEKVVAPFAGVITARNIDVGSLINAGSTSPRAMFHLAETDRLRVFVDVPQDQSQDIGPATAATLSLPQYPGRAFTGRVARTAAAIDPRSRTLRVEVDVSNADGAILPGAYAQVRLLVQARRPGLSLPLNALLFRPAGVMVATVDAGNKVKLAPVTLGRDFGQRIEITTGIDMRTRVILNPSDSIDAGQAVRIVGAGKTS